MTPVQLNPPVLVPGGSGGVHQFLPVLHRGDAVGEHTIALRELLRARGIPSEIYVEIPSQSGPRGDVAGSHPAGGGAPDLSTRPMLAYREDCEPGDVLVYQMATASGIVAFLEERAECLVVNYHNITPARFFAPWDNPVARLQLRAREELVRLAARADLGIAVSEFNRVDLLEVGFRSTLAIPPIVAMSQHSVVPAENECADRAAGDDGARWLAVGRLAPNKAIEDVLVALLAYRRRHDPLAHLDVIGRVAIASYAGALEAYAAELGIARAVRFYGHVTTSRLAACYSTADVVVTASEHEGFCAPLVEAMSFGVPVCAYAAGAVPEVLGSAGLLFDTKNPVEIADTVHRVIADPVLRESLAQAGRERLGELQIAQAGSMLVDALLALRSDAVEAS